MKDHMIKYQAVKSLQRKSLGYVLVFVKQGAEKREKLGGAIDRALWPPEKNRFIYEEKIKYDKN